MTVKPRPVRIFSITEFGKVNPRRRLIGVLLATSLRKGLEEYARRCGVEDPVFVGNTMSGTKAGSMLKYEAQEAK